VIIFILVAAAMLVVGIYVGAARSRSNAASKANAIIDDARREADVIKEKKLLEVKEREMEVKAEAEKESNQRHQKYQAAEARLKQREMQLNQQQGEIQKKRNELDVLKVNIENREQVVAHKTAEVEKLEREARETLEHISGLSVEEAKEKLIESLKDEAKTAAAGYINDIMDDARISASKEAKRIVVQTIQRVATETAV